jgi:DNA-binding transcriptional regulator YiaG
VDGLEIAVNHHGMHHYTNCGLDYVWLVNGFEYVETPQGRGVRIHDLDGLLKAIADRVISSPARLRGQEVRFLRSMLDLSQDGFARVLGQTRPSVARREASRTSLFLAPATGRFGCFTRRRQPATRRPSE